MSKTSNWKRAERQGVKFLQKYKIPAFRHDQRQLNYAISIDDIGIEGHPFFKFDSKYRKSGFVSHSLLKEIEDKYCPNGEHAVLITKGFNERGQKVTIEDEFFAMLLSYWLGFASKEELLSIYNGK